MSLKPSLILADEPTTGLDVIMVRLNLQTLAEMRDRFGTTVILVTHDMACHAEISDRIWIMYAGKLVEMGTTDQIYGDPLHPYTRGLLGAVPSLEDKSTKSIAGLAPTPLNWPTGCRFHPRCPMRMDVCSGVEPALQARESGRRVACHLYGNGEQDRNG
jgi:peptide/nickel transport system ATP-binding protein